MSEKLECHDPIDNTKIRKSLNKCEDDAGCNTVNPSNPFCARFTVDGITTSKCTNQKGCDDLKTEYESGPKNIFPLKLQCSS